MKRTTRGRRLRPEEAAKYKAIREQAAGELSDLIARHHERTATPDEGTGAGHLPQMVRTSPPPADERTR